MQPAPALRESGPAEQQQVDNVVHALSTLGAQGERLAAVIHDARNMVTALDLYCELLQEPGVLADSFVHYGKELRLVAAASRRVLDKLVSIQQVGAPLNRKSHLPRVQPDLWPPPPRLEALRLMPAGLLSPALTSLAPPRSGAPAR